MKHYIDFSNYWKNSKHIIVYNIDTFCWDINHLLCIMDDNNQIFAKHNLCETRICFGIICVPEDNLFIYVHYKYISDKPSVVIEFYEINESLLIKKFKEFIIESEYSCGGTTGRVCRIENNLFSVAWGDMSNNDHFDVVFFSKDSYFDKQTIEKEEIEKYYFLNKNMIIEPLVFAYKSSFLNIGLNILDDDDDNFISIIEKIPCSHRFDNKDIDSTILEFGIYGQNVLCLLRIKLEYNPDPLHLQYFSLDILFNVKTNSIIECSETKKCDDSNYEIASSINYENIENPIIWYKDKNFLDNII